MQACIFDTHPSYCYRSTPNFIPCKWSGRSVHQQCNGTVSTSCGYRQSRLYVSSFGVGLKGQLAGRGALCKGYFNARSSALSEDLR